MKQIRNWKKKRVKKQGRKISPEMTTAEKLILNQWNITFSNPEPARAGEDRAYQRLSKKLIMNKWKKRGFYNLS